MVVALSASEARDATGVGPKAATLARLRAAGLPVPDGVVVPAASYRQALVATGVADLAARVASADEATARRLAVEVRLGLGRAPLEALPLPTAPLVVRSSAWLEDRPGASAAGQFETFLGVEDRQDVATAVRACWASLWSTRALRYCRERGLDPAAGAMAVMIQALVDARAAGGALSRSAGGHLVLTAAWGLGPAVAQGEVVPDRYVLTRPALTLVDAAPGRKPRRLAALAGGPRWQPLPGRLATARCLGDADVATLSQLVLAVEVTLGHPVEIEWARDATGFHILQARPLAPVGAPDAVPPATGRPVLVGQPAGAGRGMGPARVVREEAELARVGVGDVLVTRVAGPALAVVLPRVAAVVAERGGSTSHLAALARERGLPAVLGVAGATRRIPDGARVLVDGVSGGVYWLR
jgi:pyruvate,water dikinase